ncbi:MAG: hypoxanthine phosphoribosyltransferase [Clostridiales bacterium]|nr:hypoxanthine phosphoribosyltransferase [Bacillota bacterium]MEE0516568.1 hypoxanthine phosphoribosyltransferase [Anaerovoracaceae bacterium]PWL93471.1 MAG: hypoxanthine phosphoribosyltransferase [Clostridiales bacterium]
MSDKVGKVLFTREQIEERAREIGEQIARDYAGEDIYLIGTLRGAVVWMADMMKNIPNDMEIDFIMASSYGSGTTSSGSVKIKKDLEGDIKGKNVIIVEDIVDTGTTLKFLKEHLAEREPKSIKICTLLDKPSRRVADIHADYTGFSIDNLFVIGYGLDYDQKYRNLPYVSYIEG